MSQQISDLVINLDVDSATFTEQVARIKGQLRTVADDSDKSLAKIGQAADRQASALKKMSDAGVSAANDIQAKQAAAADTMSKDWKTTAAAVDEAHRRVAEYSQQLQDNAARASATGKQQDQLAEAFFRQINGVKQLNGETQSLTRIQAQLRSTRDQGKISQQDYLALISATTARQKELTSAEENASRSRIRFLQQLKSQVVAQSLSKEELLRVKAAQLGAGDAAEIYIRKLEAAKKSTRALGLESAGARREIGILVSEVARGNFGALRGSGITLANRAGWIDQLMTLRGLGMAGVVGGIAAAVYGLGKAWYEGNRESAEFNKQLILTGSYAGKTSGQLAELAKSLGGSQATNAAALAQVVGSGSFKDPQIESVTRAAVAMQEATGKSVDETIKNFQKLYDSPMKASSELNTQLHYLTAGQFEYISQLERRGDKEAAGQVAADAYSHAEQQRSQQILDNLGQVEQAALATRNAFKSMWDELLNIGRVGNDAASLQSMKDTLAEINENSTQGLLGRFRNNAMGVDKAQLEENIRSLEFVVKSQEGYNRSRAAFNKINNDGVEARVSFNKYLDAGATQTEKRTLAQKELNEAIENNAKAVKATRSLSPDKRVTLWSKEDIAKAQAGIDKLYEAPKAAKAKGYVTSAGDRATDSSNSETLALQTQLKVLQEHVGANQTISQQRKKLWETEAKFSVLEDAAKARTLSKEEQSLLSSKDKVLAQAEINARLGDQIVAQQELTKLQDALRGKEEKTLDLTKQRFELLERIRVGGGISPKDYDKTSSDVAKNSITEMPSDLQRTVSKFGAAGGELPGTSAGDINQLAQLGQQSVELQKWYASNLAALTEYRQQRSDLNAQWNDQELALNKKQSQAQQTIEQQKNNIIQNAMQSSMGSVVDITKTAFGERSGIYKAAFIADKAYAIAQSMLAIQTGISLAVANPFPQNLVAMASVAAATSSIISNIKSVVLTGMAHDGIDAIPETGTWLLQKGERVMTSQTSAKLDATLENTRLQRAGPAGEYNYSPTIQVNGDPDQRTLLLIESAVSRGAKQGYDLVSSHIATGRGNVSKALGSGWSAKRKPG